MPEKKSNKAAAKKVTVEAIENKKRTWRHKGEIMTPGDTADVTEKQAARLSEDRLIK